MDKKAASKQVAGFTKSRVGRRPYKVDTLLDKRQTNSPSEVFQKWDGHEKSFEDSDASGNFFNDLVSDETSEFDKTARKRELKTDLLEHQSRVIQRMQKQPGLVVAHGTGSGKTLTSIGAIVDLNPNKAKVLVPAALQENYKKEIAKHVKGQLPVEIESIQKAVRDGRPPRGDLLIVDEAHRIRNPQSKGYDIVAGTGAEKRMLLTASPVYNRPEDIAPLVNIAAGQQALEVGRGFRNKYVKEPGKGFLTVINPWAQKETEIVNKRELGGVLKKWVDYHGSSEQGFPRLQEKRIDVPMTKRQQQIHSAAWSQLPMMTKLRLIKGLPPGKEDLASINKFQSQARQVSSSERKFVTGGQEVEASPKVLSAVGNLVGQLKKNPRHKGVVYANYIDTLKDYGKELDDQGVPYATFRGDIPKKVRDQAVKDYNVGKVKALLVSGAGGEGLDLKGTRQVQVLEPHWNEEKLKQVIGRARRYQSHAHLPKSERVVEVERYASHPTGFFGGKKKGIDDVLYNTAEQKQRLNDQVIKLMAGKNKLAEIVKARIGEFAPGIPKERRIESVPKVVEGGPNEDWKISTSLHPASRRGNHIDLRLVDPKGRAHSWAIPESDLPKPGNSSYAIQQPTHSSSYAMRKKPFSIPPGYGATRPGEKVTPLDIGGAEIVQSDKDKIRFLTHRGQQTSEYVLRKLKGREADDGKPMWAFHNATKNVDTIAGKKIPLVRPKYKDVAFDKVDLKDKSKVVQAKIDGAHVTVHLEGPDRPTRVYSHRPAKRETGVIEHTFKFPDYHKRKSPPSLKGSVLRAELWASAKGNAVPAEQVGGLLNASVPKSRKMQQEQGKKLRLSAFDVVRHKGRDVTKKPYKDRLKILKKIVRKTEGLEMSPMAVTPRQKARLVKKIREGKLPHTREGVVQWKLEEPGAQPERAKIRPDQDVYVKGVFTKERGKARGHAGGFEYSLTKGGPSVGKVGTGFSHRSRKDMLKNPDKYVGRVAKVESQGEFVGSGALRAPSFKEWHIDKTDPELMGKK